MNERLTEDVLVQQTVAEYFQNKLGWDSVFAYNDETFGAASTLGRSSQKEVVLTEHLLLALQRLNPGFEQSVYTSAIQQITETSLSKSTLQSNQEKYAMYKDSVLVSVRGKDGKVEPKRLRIFDFNEPTNNNFLVVRELWVQGHPYRRRPDILGFVNGIPLLFIELKNVHRNIQKAYTDNLSDYRDTIPHIFAHNAFIILSNGDGAKLGSITSKYEHFNEWKRLEEDDVGVVDMETMLKGVCTKANFMDLFENFILYDDSSGKTVKIVARNHQFLGVNRAIEAVKERKERDGKLGVFWHTQGSGKSYSMVFFSQKVHRKVTGNFTFLVITDREDLDKQIYKTYTATGAVNSKAMCRAGTGKQLEQLLQTDQPYLFTMIHKFNQEVKPENPYSVRDDIIVISDEAHRTQYGKLALNMRNALPNASFIGFTGTPLFKDDELTKRIFGGYTSTYDFKRSTDDNATVPLYYDNRGEKLQLATTDINVKIAEKLEELDLDPAQDALLERQLGRDYHIITAQKRLDPIAKDFVEHYTTQWNTGKAMFVCIDKVTTVRMYNLIIGYWQTKITELEQELINATDEQELSSLHQKLAWTKETKIAVVVSEEQGEVERFRKHGLDIIPHRTLMKEGFETADGRRLEMDLAFKREDHPFRVVIVCAMWLTGFDVPSLSTLYLDKPLKAHTLMQAIARANRVYEGKNNGLIVDYCGILKNLRKALATFATGSTEGSGGEGTNPIQAADEELIEELKEAVDTCEEFLRKQGFGALSQVSEGVGFEKIAVIKRAKEAINENDETRKTFEIMARVVFKKFRACITLPEVNNYRAQEAAIDIIYKKLQDDREQADISDIMRELQSVIDAAIIPSAEASEDADKIYDISKIDFEKLKSEFSKHPQKRTLTQSLKEVIENRLQKMIAQNPLRTDYNRRYQEIIADYNREKDRITIEETFAALLNFMDELDEEDTRAVREGLHEEYLALFDVLALGKELTPQTKARIKKIAIELLDALKTSKLNIDRWRDKEATKADVKVFIYNFLYDERKGLPTDSYSIEDVGVKSTFVFDYIYNQYGNYRGTGMSA